MNEQITTIKSIRIESWIAANCGMDASANPHEIGTSAHQAWDEHYRQVLRHPIADRAEA